MRLFGRTRFLHSIFFFCLFLTCLSFLQYYRNWDSFRSFHSLLQSIEHPVILLWTPFFRDQTWGFSELDENVLLLQRCRSIHSCYITRNRTFLSLTEAVIVHPRDLRSRLFGLLPPQSLHHYRSNPSQLWIYLSAESPYNVYYDLKDASIIPFDARSFDGIFNWTMTYKRNSDIQLNYGRFRPRPSPVPKPIDIDRSRKSRSIVWIVSNCKTDSQREMYVAELSKYIDVDIVGRCGNKFGCSKDDQRNSDCLTPLLERYWFYLAFENSLCRDYITEKFWKHALATNIVPVVMGAAVNDYAAIAPVDSFVHVDNFSHPRLLADYLRQLINDKEQYLRYLKWTERSEIVVDRMFEDAICTLCQKLHSPNVHSTSTTVDVSSWFSVEADCWHSNYAHLYG